MLFSTLLRFPLFFPVQFYYHMVKALAPPYITDLSIIVLYCPNWIQYLFQISLSFHPHSISYFLSKLLPFSSPITTVLFPVNAFSAHFIFYSFPDVHSWGRLWLIGQNVIYLRPVELEKAGHLEPCQGWTKCLALCEGTHCRYTCGEERQDLRWTWQLG